MQIVRAVQIRCLYFSIFVRSKSIGSCAMRGVHRRVLRGGIRISKECIGFMLEDLNESQREAVLSVVGKIRVTAGAGTGKTKTLTSRYAYLVNGVGIVPSHVLCLTFTNKAAREMSQRIARLVGKDDTSDFVSTIHGFCVKVLRRDVYRLGFPRTFPILDQEDGKVLAAEVMHELKLSRRDLTVKKFLDGIGLKKGMEGIRYVEDYMDSGAKVEATNDRFTLYLQKQLKSFALDYDDLIYFTLHLFESYPEVREFWQNELQFVMVDEAQDCNSADWRIINHITAKSGNLFVVGDPDQAIYEWRGAEPELFIQFLPSKDVILNENYRSTKAILRVANAVIKNNVNRIPKDLYTNLEAGEAVVHFHGRSELEEMGWVSRRLKQLAEQGMRYSDMVILYRASYMSRSLEQALVNERIPYEVWGGVRFFERKEIKDALGYLRLIAGDDDLAFLRIANVPPRGVGKVYLERLRAAAARDGLSLYETLKRRIDEKEFKRDSVKAFINAIEECRAGVGKNSIVSLLDMALVRSGLKEQIRSDVDEDRLENLQELVNSIQYYEESRKEDGVTLGNYLQDVALYTNADYRQEGNEVRLMTIHQAKGLEFPCVFVMGLTEGLFPSFRTIRERGQAGEEEERRLMYVAATRARKRLYLTESEGYSSSLRQEKFPSRFLLEAGRENFTTEGRMDERLWAGARGAVGAECLVEDMPLPFSSGMGERVWHPIFGEGTVLTMEESGECRVSFGGVEYSIKRNALRWEVEEGERE